MFFYFILERWEDIELACRNFAKWVFITWQLGIMELEKLIVCHIRKQISPKVLVISVYLG